MLKNVVFFRPHLNIFPSDMGANYIAILCTLESTSLEETNRCASKWFILTQKTQNLEFVNLKCVSYAQLIPLALSAARII